MVRKSAVGAAAEEVEEEAPDIILHNVKTKIQCGLTLL